MDTSKDNETNLNWFEPLYSFYTNAFNFFNKKLFNSSLKKIVITFERQGRNKTVAGYFTNRFVKIDDHHVCKIAIILEHINKLSMKVSLSTLIHEMIHFSNFINNIQDTSKSGVHNYNFKKEAEKVGYIITEKSPRIGWSAGTPNEMLSAIINEFLTINPWPYKEFDVPFKEVEKKPKTIFSYLCTSCGITVKGKKEIKLICGFCEEPMEFVEEKEKETQRILKELGL